MTVEPEVIPVLRGLSHAWAFWCALAAAIALVIGAPTGEARAAVSIYGVGLCGLFGGSALYHRWRGDPRWRPNPWPGTFGFHEVFHVFVIAAAVTHFVAIAGWVVPEG